MSKTTGKCLCGAVTFSIAETIDKVSVCHCEMCRRWNSGPMMAVHPHGGIDIGRGEALRWYRSSDWAERGFCGTCGTSLFWRLADGPSDQAGGGMTASAGAIDGLEDAALERHIFVDEKPRYYDFKDDAPQLTAAETIALFTGDGDGGGENT